MLQPSACVLVIGNEILSGRTRDGHVQTVAQTVAPLGIRVVEARCIPDEHELIVETVRALRARADLVFTTGGIGPTHDDITADAVAAAFNTPLIEHPEARRRLAEYYAAQGAELNAARLRMARIPEGARLIDNPISAAPGFVIDQVYVMAGVPKIMRAMLANVLPELPTGPESHAETVLLRSGEGEIAARLATLQQDWPEVQIGSYPGTDKQGVFVQVVFRGLDQDHVKRAAEALLSAER